jgi:hypothetical protein
VPAWSFNSSNSVKYDEYLTGCFSYEAHISKMCIGVGLATGTTLNEVLTRCREMFKEHAKKTAIEVLDAVRDEQRQKFGADLRVVTSARRSRNKRNKLR